MDMSPDAPRMTHGIPFFDRHHDDNAMSRIQNPSAISKFNQSSAAFKATNLSLDQHKLHHRSTSPSDIDGYPYQGTRKGWNKIEQVEKDATLHFMEYPSNHTILCKTRPSICVNVSHDCSGEQQVTPTAANPPWKVQTNSLLNDEKADQVIHSNTKAPWKQASTRPNDPVKPVEVDIDESNFRSRHMPRIEKYLDSFRVHSSFRRVHPAPPRSSSTHMVNEWKTCPEAPIPPDEPTTLVGIARSTHSLFHSNRGLRRHSTSSELVIDNAMNDGLVGFPRHSIYAEVDNYNLKDMGVAPCVVPSLLNAFEVLVSRPKERDEDDSSVVSFVPKVATPSRLSRADVFGEDPPTPSSSSYHDADSQPLSGCDFSRTQSEPDILGAWSNFVTETSVNDYRCDFPRVIQINCPYNDVEEFLTPSSSSTSSSTRATEEIDFAAPTALTSQPTDPPHDLAAPHDTNLQLPRKLDQGFLPPATAIWHSDFPTNYFDDHVNGLEEYRSHRTVKIKKKLLSDARRRASIREEEQGLIIKNQLEQQGCSGLGLGSCGNARWSFKGRKKDLDKGKNMAFVKVQVLEYDSRGREFLESRVERRQKVYIDDEEFEGSFPPIDRRWRVLDRSEHSRPRQRRTCWYKRIFKKVV